MPSPEKRLLNKNWILCWSNVTILIIFNVDKFLWTTYRNQFDIFWSQKKFKKSLLNLWNCFRFLIRYNYSIFSEKKVLNKLLIFRNKISDEYIIITPIIIYEESFHLLFSPVFTIFLLPGVIQQRKQLWCQSALQVNS